MLTKGISLSFLGSHTGPKSAVHKFRFRLTNINQLGKSSHRLRFSRVTLSEDLHFFYLSVNIPSNAVPTVQLFCYRSQFVRYGGFQQFAFRSIWACENFSYVVPPLVVVLVYNERANRR